MKITAIDTFTLRIPTQKPIALDLPEHRLVVTRIQTDADTDGLGYALVFGGAGSESVEAYARRLATLLIGEDPTQVGRLWDKMYRADRGIRKVGVAGYALSALDIGLWDIAGKAPACRWPSCGAPSPIACRPTAAAAGARTRWTISSAKPSATSRWAAATTR